MIVTPLILYLIRHGTDSSEALQRFGDERLTEEGVDQIQRIANFLKDKEISLLYTSPSQPANESAELISNGIGVSPIFDERIKSRDLGEVYGLTYNQVRHRYSSLLSGERFDKDWGFPGGETNHEIFLRAESFAKQLISMASGQRQKIVVISHNMVLNFLISALQGLSYPDQMFYQLEGGMLVILERTSTEFGMKYLGKI